MTRVIRDGIVGLLILGFAISVSAESAADIRKAARQRYLTGGKDSETGALFQKAADMGDPLAAMWVARLLKRGAAGLPQDNTRAAELANKVIAEVQRTAEAGDPEAQFLLGMAFSESLGVPKDDAKTYAWLLAAAKQGEAMAMNNLANMLLKGIGTRRDEAAAFSWVLKSAEKGNAFGIGNLAHYYHWGVGVEADLHQAREWYAKARRTGADTSGDMLLLTPCSREHPFKAEAIRAVPAVKLFGLPLAECQKAAMESGVISATATLEESEVGDRPGYACYADGIRFGMRFGKVRSVELYAESVEGYTQFKGTLPLGLVREDTAKSVREKLGPPDDEGNVDIDTAYGMAYTIENLTMAVMFFYENPQHIKLVRIYEKWPSNAKGIPAPDAAQLQRSGVRSHAD